ncbi:hypothetical protein MKW92_042760 [Papaver armeniacum]|nr:hypothetical protein MKW92_042760 [Papaver armeniacum]
MTTNKDEYGYTICMVCLEDLKPLTGYLQAIPTCGHVFHGPCLQQWLEYCVANNYTTCPVCRQAYCQENIIRLNFPSVWDTIRSQKLPEKGTQEDKLKKLKDKLLLHQQQQLKYMSEELNKCKEEKNKDSVFYKTVLTLRTNELLKSESQCYGYRKKLAAVKQASDINLDEEVNFASYGNADNKKYRLPIPKAGSGGGGKAGTLTKTSYLKAVQDKFQDNKEKYYEIIKVVNAIEANKIEISDALSRAEDILEGHQELISGFKILLTLHRERLRNFWLKTETRFKNDFNWFAGLKSMNKRGSMTTNDALREIGILLRHHPDLLREFNNLFLPHVVPIRRSTHGT